MTVLTATRTFAALRVAYALSLLAAPGRVARPWLGDVSGTPGGGAALRGLAARDLVLSLGVLSYARGGRRSQACLVACGIGDLADVAATLAADPNALPARARQGTVALAGASAAIALGLAARP